MVGRRARLHCLYGPTRCMVHGPGHGVGAALNVHEGPISISAKYGNRVGLEEGMVVSNEPGYYEAGTAPSFE